MDKQNDLKDLLNSHLIYVPTLQFNLKMANQQVEHVYQQTPHIEFSKINMMCPNNITLYKRASEMHRQAPPSGKTNYSR